MTGAALRRGYWRAVRRRRVAAFGVWLKIAR